MQVLLIAATWIGIGAFIWWARGSGIEIAGNAFVALFFGAFGFMLLFVGETGAVLLGLGMLAYGGYGVYVVYQSVMDVHAQRSEASRWASTTSDKRVLPKRPDSAGTISDPRKSVRPDDQVSRSDESTGNTGPGTLWDKHFDTLTGLTRVNTDGYFSLAVKDIRQQVIWTNYLSPGSPSEGPSGLLDKVRGLSPGSLRGKAIATAKARMSELEDAGRSWEAFYFGYGYTQIDGNQGAMRMESFWIEDGIGMAVTSVIRKRMLGGYEAGGVDVGDAVFPTDDFTNRTDRTTGAAEESEPPAAEDVEAPTWAETSKGSREGPKNSRPAFDSSPREFRATDEPDAESPTDPRP